MSISRRHIAVICPGSGGSGSVAAVALRQAAGLARFFRVTLISDTHPAEPVDGVERLDIKPPSFRWLHRYAHAPREIAFARYTCRALAQLKNSRDLDFVICHGHVAAALAAVPVQASLGVRYGLVTHGDIFDRPKGTYDPRLTWLYRRVTPMAYRSADLIVALSPHMQSLAKKGGAAEERIRLIPNGVDARELGLDPGYVPPPPLGEGSPLRVLFVGRLSVEKGVDTLLVACSRLSDRNVAFELRLAGDGPLRSELQDMAVKLGISEQLSFIGHVPRRDLGAEYRSCHVVCVPSRSEPFSIAAIEAMAAGRLVVGAAVGGIPMSIVDKKSGLLVAPDDPVELADVLECVAGNWQMLVTMGRHGHRECHRRFNWDGIIHQLAEAIDETIVKRSPAM